MQPLPTQRWGKLGRETILELVRIGLKHYEKSNVRNTIFSPSFSQLAKLPRVHFLHNEALSTNGFFLYTIRITQEC